MIRPAFTHFLAIALTLSLTQGCDNTPASELAEKGTVALKTTKTEEAGKLFERALAKDPKNFQALKGAGTLALMQNHLAEAERCFGKANEVKADDMEVLLLLGAVYQKWEKFDRAEALFRSIIDADPKFMQAHYNLGMLLIKKRSFAEAAKHLEAFIPSEADATQREKLTQLVTKLKARAAKS